MDRHKVRFDLFSKTIATTATRDERDIHMSVCMILFFLFGKKRQKNGSCQWIIKLCSDARIIVHEKSINLSLRNVSSAAQFDEVNFL